MSGGAAKLTIGAFLVSAFSVSLSASPIIGIADNLNCIPFTCTGITQIDAYQQVYSASAFSGPTAFNQIGFFLGSVGTADSGTYDIYFSYTSAPVDGLSASNPSANIGAGEALFGSYTLSGGSAPSALTFNGATFDYDPAMGNLLMTVSISGSFDGSRPYGFYDTDDTGTVTSRAFFGPVSQADSTGFVTDFNYASAAPEPSGVLLIVTSAAFFGPGLRRAYRRGL